MKRWSRIGEARSRTHTRRKTACHSQTLEKRSSLPPNPPLPVVGVGLLAAAVAEDACVEAVGVTGTALAQPPKSSSALTEAVFGVLRIDPTLGAAEAILLPPHPRSFVEAVIPREALGFEVVVVADIVDAEFPFFHASFEPHASASAQPGSRPFLESAALLAIVDVV